MAKKTNSSISKVTERPLNKNIERILPSIARRALYLSTQMIYLANHRSDKEKGDPKVGGHPAASASAIHILGALHLVVKTGFDHIANKPHASPADHAYSYLLGLQFNTNNKKLTRKEMDAAMAELRAFPKKEGQVVFQSYHSAYDPDHHNFFPSGTVGIPPVQAGYLALAYRYAKDHGFEVPEAHFWAVIGDSEFREGSLFEAVPDFAERELGNLTWIIDYNRQSLDGHRITNKKIMDGTDDQRIARTMQANGWQVIQVKHGSKRLELMKKPGGDAFKKWLDDDLSDYELQVLLQIKDGVSLRKELEKNHSSLRSFLQSVKDHELWEALRDLGGHDFSVLIHAMEESKKDSKRPALIIAHTLKGWGLEMAATPGNHSALPSEEELMSLRSAAGVDENHLFSAFTEESEEGRFLSERSAQIYREMNTQYQIKEKNLAFFNEQAKQLGDIPDSLDINLKLASYPHTQWMLGQLTAKLTRIANTTIASKQKSLSPNELPFKIASEMLVSMAPDVGTSTNLNPAMDGHIFGSQIQTDYESVVGVKDNKTPDLIPGEEPSDRFLRFEIVEANVMSCMGSFGKMREIIGVPLLPLMTVYDFFIKRAHDQYFYNQYWKSSFILCGTPSGVTLSAEGAQHGWKSDLQVPNQITWEPFFCQELDWILCDAMRRHLNGDNVGRSGVVIRGVTRGVEQKDFLKYLRQQKRFKVFSDSPSSNDFSAETLLSSTDLPIEGATPESQLKSQEDQKILEKIRQEVLAGAYCLIHYQGYAGYEPGENVVNIFSMGSPTTEAIKASKDLLKKGIFANVFVVTSPDLLLGHLGHENSYSHLKHNLNVNADIYLCSNASSTDGAKSLNDFIVMAGRRIPVMSVHDGEPGLLDNLGSIVGVKQESLAVRKHSRCGRSIDIFRYHGIDSTAIIQACGKLLAETALEEVKVSPQTLLALQAYKPLSTSWQDLWPAKSER